MRGGPQRDAVAVVGIGCRFPGARNVNEFWRLIRDGKVAFEEISEQRWRHASFYSADARAPDKTYATKGAFIDGIDKFAALHFGIAPRRLQVMDPQQRILIETASEALQDAGYETRPFDRTQTGVFIGASVSEYKELLTARLRAQSIADGSYGERLSPVSADGLKSAVADVAAVRAFTLSGSLLNMIAASVSQTFDFAGPSFTIDAACSSALVAIHEAVVHLRSGQCDVALAGGVYLNLTPDNLVGFSRLQVLSPTGSCRPFDARADGFVMGEGAGVVVLKRLAAAERDGDRIYAVIAGTGCSNDGHGEGPMTPRLDGQLRAIERAYRDAGEPPLDTIGFIEAHGTATAVGDLIEVGALRRFFDINAGQSQPAAHCYLGSIKANIGHTMSAAGVAGFIKAVLAVQHAVVPPQPSIETSNPGLELERTPFRLARSAQSWPQSSLEAEPRRAAVSSFGFGGTNAHIIVEQSVTAASAATAVTAREELFLISAPTFELLARHLSDLAAAIDDGALQPAAVAYTLATRAAFACRTAFVATGADDLVRALRLAATEVSRGVAWCPSTGSAPLARLARSFVEGVAVEPAELMREPDHVLQTLPPTPLERQVYWAVEPIERAYDRELRVDPAPSSGEPRSSRPVISAAAGAGLDRQVEDYVLASVAGITAFPLESLRVDRRLVGELGFDSLMLVDLEEEIRRQWPQIDKVPYDTLPEDSTILDISLYVQQQLERSEALTRSIQSVARVIEHDVKHKTAIPISRFNDVYLDDHLIAGRRVVPFAVAMNYAAEAGLEASQWSNSAPFALAGFQAIRPVVVVDTARLELETSVAKARDGDAVTDVTLSQDGVVCYRGSLRHAREPFDRPPDVSPSPSPLGLGEFYQSVTFHGPSLRGISAIHGIDAEGICGDVINSRPDRWIKRPSRDGWTIDPLIIDGGFQLAAYWIWVKHRVSVIPVQFEEYTQLAPFGTARVRCTARLENASDGKFRGTLVWTDADGALRAIMKGVTAASPAGLDLEPHVAPSRTQIRPRELALSSSTYVIDQFPEYRELKSRLQLADRLGVPNPYFRIPLAAVDGTGAAAEINFSSYNYVSASGDTAVSAAAVAAIERYGTSVSASRLASGERPLHAELEDALAAFLGTERSLVFTSGHATNVSVIGHVVGPQDLVVHDELAHDSLIQGAKLSGAKRRSFPHGDADALDKILISSRQDFRRVLICIEGVYSMDGDIPDLPRFIDIKKRHRAMLYVDEAHSLGVIGRTGRGIGEYFDVERGDVEFWMGTLSKAFASCGGFIAGGHALIEYLKYTTPGFIYSIGITPPNAAAALAALQMIIRDPGRVKRVQQQSAAFLQMLKSHGIDTGRSKDTAVIPAIIGDSVMCLRLATALNEQGINVQPMLYPAVAEASARLRFFITSGHTDDQLRRASNLLAQEIERLTVERKFKP